MAEIIEHRRLPDRRGKPRGGRRAEDQPGFAPLVLMVGNDGGATKRSEAVLAKLHFAVSVSETAAEAVRIMPELRPDLVVASRDDSVQIRFGASENVPVVIMEGRAREDPEALIEEIRRVLRLHKAG